VRESSSLPGADVSRRAISPNLATPYKIAFHRRRLESYLRGDPIHPVALELDLTSQCTRACPECPSSRAGHHHHLSRDFGQRLIARLGGRTTGLLLTGGEPTMSPLFPETLREARRNGFKDIAVVTNGSLLNRTRVADSLLECASTIRLSLYDWEKGGCHDFDDTLRRIENFRQRIDRTGSGLRIGISALTSKSRLDRPTPDAQDGVLDTIQTLRTNERSDLGIFVFKERYASTPLCFEGYHAAHFLLVVGADGKNYLGPEVKYHSRFSVADLNGGRDADFLRKKARLDAIDTVRSETYTALASRHRGVLYNHLIQRLKESDSGVRDELTRIDAADFEFPHIL